MGRRALVLLVVLLVPALSACAVPGTDTAEIAECEDEVIDFWKQPEGVKDWDERVHRLCEGLIDAGLQSDSSEGEFFAALRRNRGLAAQVCELSTAGLAAGVDEFLENWGGYVTRSQAMRLGHDGCVYALVEGYGSVDGELDAAALYEAHPYLAAPFCRAPLMQAYDAAPPPQRRRVYEEVVTEACMEGIRTGVVDYSSRDFLKPRINQRAFRAILDAEWAKR
jgi:hypothetical protein